MNTGASLVDVSAIPIQLTTMDSAVKTLVANVSRGTGAQTVRPVNSYTLALAASDHAYRRILSGDGVNLPDGKPLTILLRLLEKHSSIEQVREPSFFAHVLEQGRRADLRHYFLGGSPELLQELKHRVEKAFPGIQIAGSASPPFRDLTDAEIASQDRRIAQARPHIVWVGLGTPKQDYEAQRLVNELGICATGIGAAFDLYSGAKREAPEWMRWLSLEWLFRLATEPRRLWRRCRFENVVSCASRWLSG
jgi:N-acetylglucosaminyldiphosphoundecaprenol N-acetyl-beta-D-mannosaminyltransferase